MLEREYIVIAYNNIIKGPELVNAGLQGLRYAVVLFARLQKCSESR